VIISIKEVFTPTKAKATSPSMEAPMPTKIKGEAPPKEAAAKVAAKEAPPKEAPPMETTPMEAPLKEVDKTKEEEKPKTKNTARKWALKKAASTPDADKK